ncbi:ATP-grasp domain-containing protein [Latilactobacillus curvatus]|uniref:ATP-grasp domain-containing protein n=2 Tax=Latilactobacillus curvatus TaxID=28038 RepID=A0A385ACB0_LATCU|nr:ATP-grasp domain-containing protein [Latilactobacillus curvatus]AXN35302.1 ATP-grasp domain-containing protein [Latilactobacillus curvatus]
MMPVIYPGQTIGIIGNDQRAYMLALKAKEMGYRVAAIVTPQMQNTSFARLIDSQIDGEFNDYQTLVQLGEVSQVLTYTNELLDETVLEQLAQHYYLPQGSNVLSVTQDRYLEKVFLSDLNINIPPYATVVDVDDIQDAIDSIGYPCILKPIQKGYGKQYQRFIQQPSDLENIEAALELGTYILESWIPDAQELSVMVVKTEDGKCVTLPVIENEFEDHRLKMSLVPARINQDVATEINRLAHLIGEKLDYTGVFGVEFFLTPAMNIYVKRIMPTPHATGDVLTHTLNFSQYEYHLKAICQLAVGPSRLNNAGMTLGIQEAQRSLIQTQMKIKPDWYFNLHNVTTNQQIGSVTAIGQAIQPLIDNYEAADLY